MPGVAVVVFCDLVESTALLARLGDDAMEDVRRRHLVDVEAAVVSGGGRVVKTLGDGAMATFGSALGALRAAAGIQRSVQRLDPLLDGCGVAARVGVAAGEPISDDEDLHGMAVVLASRLCGVAGGGEVLVQDLVVALVASRSGVAFEPGRSFHLKGVPGSVSAAPLCWDELGDDGVGHGEASPSPIAVDGTERVVEAPPLPRFLAGYVREPIVAREREVELLRGSLAPGSGKRVTLVLGEPGIGKTHLAAVAAAGAHAEGAVVVLARCPPEPVVAFEPWVRGIGELALAGDGGWRERISTAAGGELTALVPELGGAANGLTSAPKPDVVSAEAGRYRLLRGVGAALACASGDASLLVVLDDAHWCDRASAQVLEHLLDGVVADRLTLVVTARERELGRGHPVSRVLAGVRRTRELSELRLVGLDERGLAALVAARVGRAITPRLASRLLKRTAGNPFFAGELARDLEDRGALRDAEALDSAPVPEAVQELLDERLARLSNEAERLLVAAAAIGPSAPIALAAEAAGISTTQAREAVSDAIGERLVDDVATARPSIRFPHALVREAFLSLPDEAASARLHLAIATALERESQPEPAELARHYGLAAPVAGPEAAVGAYRAAAQAAAAAHDHEGAAGYLSSAIALIPSSDATAPGPLQLALGEQRLLAADLRGAREAYLAAAGSARMTGHAVALAQAALGFAGGDIGFGYQTNSDETATVQLLREALEQLGSEHPGLSVRLIFRLLWAMIFEDQHVPRAGLVAQAESLAQLAGDPEAGYFATGASLVSRFACNSDPIRSLELVDHAGQLIEGAERVGRDDVLFRALHQASFAHYSRGRAAECDQAIERMAEIAERLGTPRFSWEVDWARGQRLLDRGNVAPGIELIRRGGETLRRLRPDLHIATGLTVLAITNLFYEDDPATAAAVCDSVVALAPWGLMSALGTWAHALNDEAEIAQRRLRALVTDDLEPLRRPDIHVPPALTVLAQAAVLVGDHEVGSRLRPLLEPMRPHLMVAVPVLVNAWVPQHVIGQLELLAGRPDAAVDELVMAIERADAAGIVVMSSWARIDLAAALHRARGRAARAQALETLSAAHAIAEHHGVKLLSRLARDARCEFDDQPRAPRVRAVPRDRPLRGLAARTGRRALAALVRDQDDVSLEQRFAAPRRQRALLRAMTRSFQPAAAPGFNGVIAYELEPYAIELPPDAPWRWAIEVSGEAAQLLEPAPLDAAVTVHFGLADWIRVMAGTQDPVTAMASGRCSIEGDLLLAARLDAMFGGA